MTDADTLPCVDKIAFDSQKQAIAEATATSWRRGTKLRTYHCRGCGLWHLASHISGNQTD